ncbi:NAD(P)-dependent oxidoreductase [Vibrio sp. CDRSL-10 TSBA]
MLGDLDILVNLLPLNEQTEGILNRALLSRLPKRAALIHCGRGAQLVEQDLIDLLDHEQLRGSILDVFAIEPLPESSNLWSMDKVLVTPHIASSASIPQIVRQISATASELAQQENR